MNSVGNVLSNFEWLYEGTVFFKKGTGFDGKGISRTMFLAPTDLETVPEQLFALKVSQSKDPELAGKFVFKYFSYRFNADSKFTNLAPEGITLQTELSVVKATVISKFAAFEQQGMMPSYSLNVKLHGTFTNITCADDTYALYDEEKFPNADPNKKGEPDYYLKGDAVIQVKLKGAVSQGNEYLQSTLSTVANANDIFQKRQQGKVWGSDDGVSAAAPAEAPENTGTPGPVW